ncbi:MAG: LL-diaminopimelate aminotransferase [Myxococcota bacterium]
MEIRFSERVKKVPPYLFARLDKMQAEARARGADIISLSIGDPDLPTPDFIVKKMQEEVAVAKHHRYPSYEGSLEYREAVARYYKRHFKVSLDPKNEILALIGSKDGIAHTPLALIDSGDEVLVPSPGYPVYNVSTIFATGTTRFYPLLEKNSFIPDLDALEKEPLDKVKLIWVNYPNNPTGAGATREFYKKLVEFARRNNIIVCADSAYLELAFESDKRTSILEVEGAKELAIEFGSLSKTYNMTGWRIGWAAGNEKLVSALGQIKTNVDSGAFTAIQYASITALDEGDEFIEENREIWRKRRDIFVEGLKKLGYSPFVPSGSFFVWVRTPKGVSSMNFVERLLKERGVMCTPGVGFGEEGEGYIRFALTVGMERLKEALERIGKVNW